MAGKKNTQASRGKSPIMRKIRAKMARIGIDGLLLSDEQNIRYLTGFHFSGVLLVDAGKNDPLYFVNPMNASQAEKLLGGAEITVITAPKTPIAALAEYIGSRKIKKVGINPEKISIAAHDRLVSLMPKVKFVTRVGTTGMSSVLECVREIKSPEEIRILRKAGQITIRIWRDVCRKIKTGMSEKEIAAMVDICVRRLGHENSFPTIAAVGVNTAYPHAIPTSRRLKKDEHLLVDFGIRYQGYCSDLTRIYDNGRIDRQIRVFRKSVEKALDSAVKRIKDGVGIRPLVEGADDVLRSGGQEADILHGLGHGVGLDVHERPFLNRSSREKLVKGMVVTVEPGLYKPGVGGVRLEDMVLVTAKGCEVLTR
ncbi:MAG: Xaa-Pro peptidase family protein [Candidatus Omnitrophota bacterium]